MGLVAGGRLQLTTSASSEQDAGWFSLIAALAANFGFIPFQHSPAGSA